MQRTEHINQLIQLALQEDIGRGDLTSEFFVNEDSIDTANVTARETLIVSGSNLAHWISSEIDTSLEVTTLIQDGELAQPGDAVINIQGKSRSILTAERSVLNFMQRLSGISTLTHQYAQAIKGTDATLLDTRKTTPGWRALEKYAVTCGGGSNHRHGLYDRVMVKDNHIAALGGIAKLQEYLDTFKTTHPNIPIEVEVDKLEQLKDLLRLQHIDYVLLDNMSTEQLKAAVNLVKKANSPFSTEASGGVNLETIRSIAETGVDFISVGAITHSATAVDLGMDFV